MSQIDYRDHIPNILSYKERIALQELGKREDMIVKPADKGGLVVVMDPPLYEDEVTCQLYNQTIYRKVANDPTWGVRKQLENILKLALKEGIITRDLFEFLLPPHTKTPVLYTLPKIHKNSQSPPGHPIVSGRDSIFVPSAQFLDKILSPLVRDTKFYIRDTNEFLLKLKNVSVCQKSDLLVTWDVASLYTSIPYQPWIYAVMGLIRNSNNYSETQMSMFEKLFQVVLSNNYILFNRLPTAL